MKGSVRPNSRSLATRVLAGHSSCGFATALKTEFMCTNMASDSRPTAAAYS
jgi:hypothetical protein